MCKVKPYSDAMQSYLTSVFLRLDTYFLYDDFREQAKLLKELSNGIPAEIPFDEILEQQIDVDSVADLHDTYINKILDSDLIRLSNASINGMICDVFVNTYFIAFLFKAGNIPDPQQVVEAINQAYLQKYNYPLQFSYLRLNYSVLKQEPGNLWNICDRSAFPVIQEGEYNGRYTDSIERNGVFIDLSRSISPSEPKSEEIDVNIQTKAVLQSFDLRGVSLNIGEVTELSKQEISRCFTR